MHVQRELIQALQRDADFHDRQRREDLARLAACIVRLQRQADMRWSETEQNVSALYLLSQKGTQP